MTRLLALLLILALGGPPSSAPQPVLNVAVATRSPAATPGSFPSPAVALEAARDADWPRPSMPGAIGTPLLGGWATWYRATGNIAAAGPALREHLGKGWRGTQIRVTANGRSVVVVVSDWCRCKARHGLPTLIDLSDDSYRRLAPLSTGVLAVEVEVLGGIDLPETDADG